MATRGSYVHISMGDFLGGHPDNISFMQFSTKIAGFEQKDSQSFENSYNSYEHYPLEEFFSFHHLPKLYFGFKLLKYIKENNKKICNTFDHNFKYIPLYIMRKV